MARHIGVSNMGPWSCEMLQANLDQKLEVNQLQFGLCHAGMVRVQMHENMDDDAAADRDGGVLAYSQLTGMTIQAWSPLQYGMFAGTFIDNEQFSELNQVLAELAEAKGVSKEAIAVAWSLAPSGTHAGHFGLDEPGAHPKHRRECRGRAVSSGLVRPVHRGGQRPAVTDCLPHRTYHGTGRGDAAGQQSRAWLHKSFYHGTGGNGAARQPANVPSPHEARIKYVRDVRNA